MQLKKEFIVSLSVISVPAVHHGEEAEIAPFEPRSLGFFRVSSAEEIPFFIALLLFSSEIMVNLCVKNAYQYGLHWAIEQIH